MRDYELVMVLSPEVDEEGVTRAVERVAKIVTDGGGALTHQELWGQRRLAYPIRRFREGKYVLTRFTMEPARAAPLEGMLRTSPDVIRHLLVTTPA